MRRPCGLVIPRHSLAGCGLEHPKALAKVTFRKVDRNEGIFTPSISGNDSFEASDGVLKASLWVFCRQDIESLIHRLCSFTRDHEGHLNGENIS